MALPGPKPKPYLTAVRSGNPGHRKLDPGMVLPPSDPVEPDWSDLLPGRSADTRKLRETAAATWARTALMLTRSAGLTNVQRDTLQDYCVTIARIEQAERHLALDGVVVETERGNVKSPWVTVLNQYRSHFRSLIGELGLSPAAARRVPSLDLDDDDDILD